MLIENMPPKFAIQVSRANALANRASLLSWCGKGSPWRRAVGCLATNRHAKPTDASVTIREIPARKMAAIRYSGSWSQKKYEARKTLLEDFIGRKGLKPIGPDIFARYDPPFQLWFLRRNEVLFPVE